MIWLFTVLAVLLMGGIALVAAGRGAPMVEEHPDRPDVLVPADRPIGAADLRRVRFPVVLRGYRMADVDALLDRLAREQEQAHQGDQDQPGPGVAGPGVAGPQHQAPGALPWPYAPE